MALAHGRLRIFWIESRRTSFCQCAASRRKCCLAFHFIFAVDRLVLAGSLQCRPVCVASVARRVGRVDFRTQGCFKHVFRVTGVVVLRAICREIQSLVLFVSPRLGEKFKARCILHPGVGHVCPRSYEQANDCDAAFRDAAIGLLAIAAIFTFHFLPGVFAGKMAVLSAGGHFVRNYFSRAAGRCGGCFS